MKKIFDELREYERTSVPAFDVVLQRKRRHRGHIMLVGAAAAAIAVVLLWPRHINDDVVSQNITQWRAPTDALLPPNYHSVVSFEGLQ